MDSRFIAEHLRLEHKEVLGLIKYISKFITHPKVSSLQVVREEDGSISYRKLSHAMVLAICIKLDQIEMVDPLILNYEYAETVSLY